jgi:hypothetical protein
MVVALLGLTLPVLGLSGVKQLKLRKEDDTAYSLVQYNGMACQASKYVCQHLTKGACTITTAHDGGISFQVYSELVDDADGTFTVKACEKEGCDCTYTTQWTPNECSSGTYGGTSISYMLVPGEIEGCITYDFDVAGGRHHDAYETAMQNTTAFSADNATDVYDDGAALVQHKTEPSKTEANATEEVKAPEEAKAPVMDVAGAVTPPAPVAVKATVAKRANVASFYHNWGVPAPSQGFEGDDVEHEDYESTTKDWGKEYGPDMYDYSGKPKKVDDSFWSKR